MRCSGSRTASVTPRPAPTPPRARTICRPLGRHVRRDDDKLTSNTVSVVVAGAATQGDVGTSVETLQPGQVATIDVLFTDADGNIAPDGTPTRISAAGQTFASTGTGFVTGATSNGRVSATLLPSGSDAVVTILAQAGEGVDDTPPIGATATATGQVSQSSGVVVPVASAIVVTAGSTELAMGESTRVSATVTDADGDRRRGRPRPLLH